MGYTPECSHLERLNLVSAIHFALQTDFVGHFAGVFGQHSGRHAIARFIHQFASKVLRFADNASLVHGSLYAGLVAMRHHGQSIDVLVLAIALVGIGIEVAYECAFDNGFYRIFTGDIVGSNKSKAAKPASFQGTHRSPCQSAQFEGRKILGLATTQKQQALGLQLGRTMQQGRLKDLCRDLTAGDDIGDSVLDFGLVSLDGDLGLFHLAVVECHDNETFGLEFDRISE